MTEPLPLSNATSSPQADHGLHLNREQREYVRREVLRRTLEEQKDLCKRTKDLSLEVIINDALYQEQERLRGEKKSKTTRVLAQFWGKVADQFHQVTDEKREEILAQIVDMYVKEIMGYFNPVIHGLAARIIPWGLKAMLSRFSPKAILKSMSTRLNLEENLNITGPVDSIRKLAGKATLIMAPTHVSNLDSVVIGLGLYMSQLPPFTYGAGLNLFSNPVISFFMNNVGAYKVDRRKKNGIYKSALKQYATLSMEMGQHNLFFPGGTRSRSGEVEQHLKLGLLGCGVNVYVSNLLKGKPHPDLFIIPCTLSYGLVLEARSLVDDYLKETGKSRYIRVRSDFNRPMRVLNFWRNLQSMDSKIHMHFGEPLDLFGNRVNENGISYDSHGRVVDRKKYVEQDGQTIANSQRDQEYTRELGRSIQASFLRNNVTQSTHTAAFALFEVMRKAHPNYDLYRILRTEGLDTGVPKKVVLTCLATVLKKLGAMAESHQILLAPDLVATKAEDVFAKAMTHFRSFHNNEVIREASEQVYTLNIKLLYYYRNRLEHYGLSGSN